MEDSKKTHYRKAFNSPYLSSADIVGPTTLTISRVQLEGDKTKRTKDLNNTAYFVEQELRPGEALKPMILNATNSRTMKDLTGSHYIDDWANIPVTIYVQEGVRFGRDTVDGLRISPQPPVLTKPELTPDNPRWAGAVAAFKRDGNLKSVMEQMTITKENQQLIIDQAGKDNE